MSPELTYKMEGVTTSLRVFTGEQRDWSNHKFRLEMALKKAGLYGLVVSNEAKAEVKSKGEKGEEGYQKRSIAAFTMIAETLKDEQLLHVRDLDMDPKKAWETL